MDFKKFINGALGRPEKGDKVEYFNLRNRVSGYILTKAQRNSPTAGYNYEADITKFWNEFQNLKENCGYPLSFNTIMMKVLIEGLKVAPKLNAHIKFNTTSSCGTLVMKKHIDVAMPVVLENGETFPVKVKETENKSLKELAEQINDLLRRLKQTDVDKVMFDVITQRTVGLMLSGAVVPTVAQTVTGYVGKHKVAKFKDLFNPAPKDGSMLFMDELNEGSVCLTNWGVLYDGLNGNVTYTPLLYPQTFLMAMGVIKDSDYAFRNEKGEVDIGTKKLLPITLMFDHRIGAFNDVMPFIKKLDEIFQNPQIMREW
ncbi:MAG: 2-oxo acid dehydrogenase subunit E2 [Clostridia bacterium]|nr:2-oxo acid dehydrogenase subunit E2 [Clostridia bacterium]